MRYRNCENCQSEIDAREVVTRCPECKELINKPKTETMNNLKKGDKVFVYPYGWCELVATYIDENWCIKHNNQKIEVHKDLISFTEYTLEGFTKERPFEPKIDEYYFFWDDEMLDKKAVINGKLGEIDKRDNYPYYCVGAGCYNNISETNPLL
jgi:hypothetical protein